MYQTKRSMNDSMKNHYLNSDSDSEMRSTVRKSYKESRGYSSSRDPYKLENLNEPDLSDHKSSSRSTKWPEYSKDPDYSNDQFNRSMKLAPLKLSSKSYSDDDIRDKAKKPSVLHSSRGENETIGSTSSGTRKSNMQISNYNPYSNYSEEYTDTEKIPRKSNRDSKSNESSRGFSSKGFLFEISFFLILK